MSFLFFFSCFYCYNAFVIVFIKRTWWWWWCYCYWCYYYYYYYYYNYYYPVLLLLLLLLLLLANCGQFSVTPQVVLGVQRTALLIETFIGWMQCQCTEVVWFSLVSCLTLLYLDYLLKDTLSINLSNYYETIILQWYVVLQLACLSVVSHLLPENQCHLVLWSVTNRKPFMCWAVHTLDDLWWS